MRSTPSFGTARRQAAGRFVKRSASMLRRLILSSMSVSPDWRRAGVSQRGVDGAGLRDAVRRVERDAEGERGDRPDARNGRQPAAGRLVADDSQILTRPRVPLRPPRAARPAGRDDGQDGLVLAGEVST